MHESTGLVNKFSPAWSVPNDFVVVVLLVDFPINLYTLECLFGPFFLAVLATRCG